LLQTINLCQDVFTYFFMAKKLTQCWMLLLYKSSHISRKWQAPYIASLIFSLQFYTNKSEIEIFISN
jgi:hypothetical protein